MRINKLILVIAGIVLPAISIQAQIENFEVNHVYKTASSVYKVLDDDNFANDSTDVFTVASVSLQWPVKFGDNNVKALQDTILSQAFDMQNVEVDEAIRQYLAKPVGYGYYQLQVVSGDRQPDDKPYSHECYTALNVSSVGFCEKYIVFKCDYYEDGFGPHPNFLSHFINYDIKGNRTFFFNDLFEAGHEQELLEIVTQALLDKYFATSIEDLEDKSGIFADNIHVSRDVYINGDKIVFYYNPYEIGPWAIGVVEVAIPIFFLTNCLTDEARELLQP